MIAGAFVYGGTIAATVEPTTVSGYYNAGGTHNVDTGDVIAAGAGGVAPYSYAWSQVDTSPYTWTISAPTAATTHFTITALPEGVSDTVTFRVRITDAAGATGSKDLTATAINNTYVYVYTGYPF